jgi:YVTN family beta-propeller protein
VGVGLHSVHQYEDRKSVSRRLPRHIARFAVALAAISIAGCGNQYRPVVSSINPVGPAAQPQKYAVVVSNTSTTANPNNPGLVNIIDFSGDNTVVTASLGQNPYYLILDASGSTGFTLNGDGTVNSFGISTSLLTSTVNQTTLLPGAAPAAILAQGTNLYIAEPGRSATAQLTQGTPPALKQELPTGAGSVYTVGAASAPRVYSIVQGTGGGPGTVRAVETATNTISNSITVGRGPVYGVMTADGRRAFILNKTDGTVSVVNSQTNALDTFTNTTTNTASSTVPVGVAPVWADFDPTRSELLVANAGNGTTPGSVTIVNIPLCSASTVTTNPNCDPANPVDATGFGQVLSNITVGVNPVMIAVLQDGTQAYVANAGNAAAGIAGSVSVINLQTNTVIATIPAITSSNPNDTFVHGHPNTIAVTTGTPTGKVYVTAADSTDLTIIRTDIDTVATHLTLQGTGVQVRVNTQ